MYRLIIAAHGDNEALHREALKAAVQAVEDANPTNSVYRAYLEKIEDGKIVGVPNGHAADPSRAIDAPADIRTPPREDYKVTIQRGPLGWMWKAERPNGTTFGPMLDFNMYATKEKAEEGAARALARDASAYTVSGETLRNRASS